MDNDSIEKIYNGLMQFGHYMKVARHFSVDRFMSIMEPIFSECGCRQGDCTPQQKRVLIITQGGAGDFVLISPCLKEIRRIYPQAHITAVVMTACRNLAETCPYIDELILADFRVQTNSAIKLYEQCADVFKCRISCTFDVVFNFDDLLTGVLLGYMSGACERILHVDEDLWTLWHDGNIPYEIAKRLSTVTPAENAMLGHYVDRHLATVSSFTGLNIVNHQPEVWYTQQDMRHIRKLWKTSGHTQAIVLCMGGAGGGIKSYPAARYVELLRRIVTENANIHIVIVGGKSEITAGCIVMEGLSAVAGDRVHDFTNQLSYRQTAAMLSLCDFYIGNDTGVMHIAAAAGLPVLAIFSYPADLPSTGNSTVEVYYPYLVPAVIVQPDRALPECRESTHQFRYLYGCSAMRAHCIAQISVDEVYRGWRQLLNCLAKKK